MTITEPGGPGLDDDGLLGEDALTQHLDHGQGRGREGGEGGVEERRNEGELASGEG